MLQKRIILSQFDIQFVVCLLFVFSHLVIKNRLVFFNTKRKCSTSYGLFAYLLMFSFHLYKPLGKRKLCWIVFNFFLSQCFFLCCCCCCFSIIINAHEKNSTKNGKCLKKFVHYPIRFECDVHIFFSCCERTFCCHRNSFFTAKKFLGFIKYKKKSYGMKWIIPLFSEKNMVFSPIPFRLKKGKIITIDYT